MILKNINKKLFFLILLILFIGSIGCYLLYIYKLWPFSDKKIEIPDEKLLNDFVEKGTNIYLERSDKFLTKQDVELRIFSIIVFLKALTSNVSKELFDYLNYLKIKDLYGFKNFIIYLKSKLILEDDKEKIFRILDYFFNEGFCYKPYSDNDYKYLHSIRSSWKDEKITSSNVWYKAHNEMEDLYLREIYEWIFTENLKISNYFITRILDLQFEKNFGMLVKVNKKEKNSCSILEKIFFKFLMRGYYDSTINIDLSKLIPNFKTRAGNPFFADEEILDNDKNQKLYNRERFRRFLANDYNVPRNLIFLNDITIEDVFDEYYINN